MSFQGTYGQIPSPASKTIVMNNFLSLFGNKVGITKQVTLRCVSNFVRNINLTYYEQRKTWNVCQVLVRNLCLKTVPAKLYIESLPRTEPTGLFILPQRRQRGRVGSYPTNGFLHLGTRMGQGTFLPWNHSLPVSVTAPPHREAESVHMSSCTRRERRNLTCRCLKQSWVLFV